MFNYRLEWYDGHEESSQVVLMHEKQYSQEEFNNLIESCLPEIFEKFREDQIESTKLYSEKYPDNAEEINEADIYEHLSPNYLYSAIVDIFLDKYGFQERDYKAEFYIKGYIWGATDSNVDIEGALGKNGYQLQTDKIKHGYSESVWRKINNAD